MKNTIQYIIIKTIIIFFIVDMANADESKKCWDKAMTQMAMNKCASLDCKKSEKILNNLLVKIKKKYKKEKLFLKKLEESQNAWIKSRDKNLILEYPWENPYTEYGSIFPMCFSQAKATLIEERIKYLQGWIIPTVEGDCCVGSRSL